MANGGHTRELEQMPAEAWVAKEEPETVAAHAPLGTAPAAPGITRPTPGRRRAPRVVRAGTPVSWGVRSVLAAVRRHGATSNPGAVLDDEAGSGGETAVKFTEKLSVSVRTHRRSPPAPRPASHAAHAPS